MSENFGPGLMGGVVLVDPTTGQPYKGADFSVADLTDPETPAGAALSSTYETQTSAAGRISGEVTRADSAYSRKTGVDVRQYGAVGDGVADDTAAIQAAIDAVKAAVRAWFGAPNVVILPAGRYKVTATIIQPTYVKVVTAGSVVILSAVAADSAWRIAPLADDPDPLYATMQKQQWLRGSLLDGSEGGITFVNTLATGTTAGLELGSRTALAGTSRAMCRYSLNDIAIQGYASGIRWNTFNHFIASYHRMHLEVNTVSVSIGSGSSTNAGENIAWYDSVFAACDTAFLWGAAGTDMQFVNCSFDFLTTAFLFNYGWQRVMVIGGHFEGVNEGVRETAIGGIAVSNVGAAKYPEVKIGSTPIISKTRGVQFRGNQYLDMDLSYRNFDDFLLNQAASRAYLCDSSVKLVRWLQQSQVGQPLVARSICETRDPCFDSDAAGVLGSALTRWARSSWGTGTDVVDADTPIAGGKSVAFTIGASSGLTYTQKAYSPCTPGDVMLCQLSYKFDAAPYPTLTRAIAWYDSEKVQIGATVSLDGLRTTTTAGVWSVSDSPARFVAPAGAAFYKASFSASLTTGTGAVTYRISDLHASKAAS